MSSSIDITPHHDMVDVPVRPPLAGHDPDGGDRLSMLSYYQSPLADGYRETSKPGSPTLQRQLSVSSIDSGSDYSEDSTNHLRRPGPEQSAAPSEASSSLSAAAQSVRRRSSIPSEGGADRRRLVIMPTDAPPAIPAPEQGTYSSSNIPPLNASLRARRGVNGGLALVAPPDAAPRLYSHLTPPSTAPIVMSTPGAEHPSPSPSYASPSSQRHHRSASEAVPGHISPRKSGLRHKSSRDVAIVGTGIASAVIMSPHSPLSTTHDKSGAPLSPVDYGQATDHEHATPGLRPPIFLRPQSRSPSPGGASYASDASATYLPPADVMYRREYSEAGPSRRREFSHGRRGQLSDHGHENKGEYLARSERSHRHEHDFGHKRRERANGHALGVPTKSSPIVTPEIGMEKRIDDPVAAPIVVSIDSGSLLPAASNTNTSATTTPMQTPSEHAGTPTQSYLHYQPGLHATAGPLPLPPRFFGTGEPAPPPPRPPRLNSLLHSQSRRQADMEVVRKALQLPSSVSAVLEPKTVATSISSSPPSMAGSSSSVGVPFLSVGTKAFAAPSSAVSSALAPSVKHEVTDRAETGSAQGQAHYYHAASPSAAFSNEPKPPPRNVPQDVDSLPPSAFESNFSSHVHAAHRREGAFAPSTDSTISSSSSYLSSPDAVEPTAEQVKDVKPGLKADTWVTISVNPATPATPTTTDTLPPPAANELVGRDGSALASEKPTTSPPSSFGRMSSSSEREHDHDTDASNIHLMRGASPAVQVNNSDDARGDPPSPPTKSMRNSWTTNLKRFSSLPRTPSRSSTKRSSVGSNSVGRSPSPSPDPHSPGKGQAQPLVPQQPPTPVVVFATPTLPFASPSLGGSAWPVVNDGNTRPRLRPSVKIVSIWPAAMYCGDVTGRKTSLERCKGYADKINELYLHDCGLEAWMTDAQMRISRSPQKGVAVSLASPTSGAAAQQRHTSRSSLLSEVTFPRRPDATSATDLSGRSPSTESPSPALPPALPYPTLALQGQRATPTRSVTTINSISAPGTLRALVSPSASSLTKPGFFASLGRKASLRKDRPGGSGSAPALQHLQPHSSPGKLVKTAPNSPAGSVRQVNIVANPSVPGGPRAPPNRMLRSQTVVSSQPQQTGPERVVSVTQRPLQLTTPPTVIQGSIALEPVLDIQADPDFAKQVDRLADLLPQADRDVLAGYLRRAGQDMLAIGQYLDDEKHGTLRRD